MLVARAHFLEDQARETIARALQGLLPSAAGGAMFICIGSDRHLLDCFGPLTGTILQEKAPHLQVFGTLDRSLHAKNIRKELPDIKARHPHDVEIAIDASIGEDDALGFIHVRKGSIIPGKALARNLPPVGHFSITGVVGTASGQDGRPVLNNGSFYHVYHMARLTAEAIALWGQDFP